MLPIAGITFVNRIPPSSVPPRHFDVLRSGSRVTIAAWLLMLMTPADGASPQAASPTPMGRLTPPMTGLFESLTCPLLWADYHLKQALGIPCTPPNC